MAIKGAGEREAGDTRLEPEKSGTTRHAALARVAAPVIVAGLVGSGLLIRKSRRR